MRSFNIVWRLNKIQRRQKKWRIRLRLYLSKWEGRKSIEMPLLNHQKDYINSKSLAKGSEDFSITIRRGKSQSPQPSKVPLMSPTSPYIQSLTQFPKISSTHTHGPLKIVDFSDIWNRSTDRYRGTLKLCYKKGKICHLIKRFLNSYSRFTGTGYWKARTGSVSHSQPGFFAPVVRLIVEMPRHGSTRFCA